MTEDRFTLRSRASARHGLACAALLGFTAPLLASTADAAGYIITAPGLAQGWTDTQVVDLSNSGQALVTGKTPTPDGYSHSFLWGAGGSLQDLGVPTGASASTPVTASKMNENGAVVGYYADPSSFLPRPFLWTNGPGGGVQALPLLPSANFYGFAFDINNGGSIAGLSVPTSGVGQATLWNAGTPQSLSLSKSWAYAINSSGTIAGGTQDVTTQTNQAVRWTSGGAMQLLGFMSGYDNSNTAAMNDSGVIAGVVSSSTTGGQQAVIWSASNVIQSLGSLGGSSTSGAINSNGDVVGKAYIDAGDTTAHAFLWNGTSMIDLNTLLPAGSGWVLTEALAINDLGQIGGYGFYNGQQQAFLLTPDIPEPATAALLGAGLLGLGLFRRRRRG